MNDFNTIAPVYDLLSRFFFLGTIQKAQTTFVDQIEKADRILILGGGSGWVLKALKEMNRPLTVDFVDPSARMIEKAKKQVRNRVDFQINFYQLRFADFEAVHSYDWVHCGFFLDLFNKVNLQKTIDKIMDTMNNQTKLVITDFQLSKDRNRYWQRPFSIIMHWFFGVIAKMESKKLRDIQGSALEQQLTQQGKETFFGNFIFSTVFIKNVQQKNSTLLETLSNRPCH